MESSKERSLVLSPSSSTDRRNSLKEIALISSQLAAEARQFEISYNGIRMSTGRNITRDETSTVLSTQNGDLVYVFLLNKSKDTNGISMVPQRALIGRDGSTTSSLSPDQRLEPYLGASF